MTRLSETTGWWGAPLAWALSTQLGQILPHADCGTRHSWSGVTTFATLALAVVAAAWSARLAQRLTNADRFIALSGSVIASIVAFAVLLQGTATLVIDACTR